MIYNKNNLVIHSIANNEKTSRIELSGVMFKKDRSVATDSYKLIEVKNDPEVQKQLSKDYPELQGKAKPLYNFQKSGYIVPAKAVNKALKNLSETKNRSKNLPVLDNCIFLDTGSADITQIASTDLEKTDIVNIKNINRIFPQYDQVMPKSLKNHRSISISIKHLKAVLDVIEKMDLPKNNGIELLVKDDNSPVVIKAETMQKQEVTGLVMPLRK